LEGAGRRLVGAGDGEGEKQGRPPALAEGLQQGGVAAIAGGQQLTL
jgi:hypothetical protein